MSHVAEGELHAWLDGAVDELGEERAAEVREHLRACSACQRLLAGEEALRARAAELLVLTAPRSSELPPLETLMERARGASAVTVARESPATRPGRISRGARLGWAASIVVALGAGWTARELVRARAEVADERLATASAPAAELQGSGAALSAEAAPPPPQGPAQESATPGSEAPAESDLSSRAPASNAGGSGRVEAPLAPVAGAAPAPRTAAGPEEVARPQSAQPSEAAGASADAAGRIAAALKVAGTGSAPAANAKLAAEAPASWAAPADRTADVRGAAGSTAARSAPARREAEGARRAASAVGVQPPRVERARSDVPELFVEGRARVGPARQSDPAGRSEPPSSEADLDEALDLIVPGLEVLRVEWAEVAPGQRGLRVLQRLQDGDTLEIRFVRSGGAAADAAADPLAEIVGAPQPEGWSQAIQVHGDGWIVARAPVARDELEALLEAVGQPRR